ncbi:MAG TPA: G5 domain-containing protein [Aggregatilineaceae bacterium]|nr:G5 domain-containing protein [Anaerolineae bacterium]HMM28457.1 G5 domain-containing protein [Aggregatilineaceae bacterium]
MNRIGRMIALLLVLGVTLAACQDEGGAGGRFNITVDADGASRVYTYDKPVSVGQFLEAIDVTLDALDEVNPPLYTQLRDGLRITVTRVVERQECVREPVPFKRQVIPSERLKPGEEQIGQTGEAGENEICYLITEKNGVEVSRNPGIPVPVRPARDEIVYVGAEPSEAVISIDGVLAYISGDQPWIIERSTARRRPVAEVGGLDRRVFDLSADGRQLLFTRATEDENDPVFSNELWAVLNTSARTPQAVQLFPNDVLSAQWVPGRANTLSYSTAVPTSDQIGWRAYNDLFTVELDPQTGEAISDSVEQIVEQNALGAYAYWGRRFLWSPSGERLAWANADSVGTVDLERGEFVPLLSFAEYATLLPLVWVPTLSWSEDGLLITTAHGAPYGTESREDSIVFDTAVLDAENELVLPTFRAKSGIWSSPSYSPLIEHADGRTETLVAYFQAREPLNSLGSTYDLWIADADGSNARKVFPGPDDPGQGFRSPDPEDGIAWSPTGTQLAFIYQQNLWIYDLDTGLASAVTSDGQAARPRWSGAP